MLLPHTSTIENKIYNYYVLYNYIQMDNDDPFLKHIHHIQNNDEFFLVLYKFPNLIFTFILLNIFGIVQNVLNFDYLFRLFSKILYFSLNVI